MRNYIKIGQPQSVRLKKKKIAQSVDRISSLPDAVLRHILSFLPTKYAACTSILSTRWRYLFPFTRNLDFDDSLMFNPRKNDHSPDAQSEYFMKFVDRYIMLSNVAHIDKFRLTCLQVLDNSRVNSWICAALVRNVRELDLCISTKDPGFLPRCVFTCSTLVVLKLDAGFFLNVPASVYLPCLKCLYLDSIEFPDDISTQRLFSSCPALEELDITRCSMKNISVFNLSSPTLKRLTMGFDGEQYSNYKLALEAPRLVYLNCTASMGEGYTLKNLRSLFEAYICFSDYNPGVGELEPFLEFLEGISCVRSLYLCGAYPSILRYIDVLPVFNNMTHLKLREEEDFYWYALLKLLHCSPNLEELVFEGSLFDLNPDNEVVDEDEANNNVPHCMSHHLKTVEFQSIDGCWDRKTELPFELRCIEYFLKNSEVLETVRICIANDERHHLGVTTRLLEIPRLSKTCKVIIY